jgi:predicted kinase
MTGRMSPERPVLHFIAGKVASGKTTLARRLARELPAVHLCEDQWIALLGGEVRTLRDYVRQSYRCRKLMGPQAREILRVGTSLVLDFAGNTPHDRAWVRSLFAPLDAAHVLHVIDAPDALCLERLRQRNAERPEGRFWFEVDEAVLVEAARYFVPPTDAEGFHVVHHDAESLRGER